MHRLQEPRYSYERLAEYLNHEAIAKAFGGPWQTIVVWGIIPRIQPKHGRKIA